MDEKSAGSGVETAGARESVDVDYEMRNRELDRVMERTGSAGRTVFLRDYAEDVSALAFEKYYELGRAGADWSMAQGGVPEQFGSISETAAREAVRAGQYDASAQRMANATGRTIRFYDDADTGVNGYYDPSSGEIRVNLRSENPLGQIVAHELTHTTELGEAYGELRRMIFGKLGSEQDLDALRRAKQETYARSGVELDAAGVDAEIVAEYVEQHLLTDEAAILEVAQQRRSVAQRIHDWIDRVLAKLGVESSKERVFLEQARRLYAKALEQTRGAAEAAETRRQTREAARYGEMTDEEFDAMLERESLGGESMLEPRFSISEKLDRELDQVLDGSFPTRVNEVYIGETSNFLTDVIGADDLSVTMPAGKAYSAMVTEEQAKADGRYREGTNYHGLGRDGLMRVLESSEDPVAAFADTPGERGKRANNIVLVTDETGPDGNIVVVEALSVKGASKGRRFNANKVITSYDRGMLASDIEQAAADGRLLHLDKKRSQAILAGMPAANSRGAIRDADFDTNIRNFMAGVKWENAGERTYTAGEQGGQTEFARAFEEAQRKKNGRKYSVDETAGTQTERGKLPTRAAEYLRRSERKLAGSLASALDVPTGAKREFLMPIVQEISEEYLKDGKISEKTVDRLFDTAYEQGIVEDDTFYNDYKEVKDYLRNTAVTISKEDRADIPDFDLFRKDCFGRVRIVNEGGLPVDSAYGELRSMAPALFPDNLTHPAGQLQQMAKTARSIEKVRRTLDEYYGPDAEEFRRYARHDFAEKIYDQLGQLQTVKRFADEKAAEQTRQEANRIETVEQAAKAYEELKTARRNYERVNAKQLLTDSDRRKVNELLRGIISLDSLKEGSNASGIRAVYEARREYEDVARRLRDYNTRRKAALRDQADGYLETANDWKDKKAGILYARETMERNVRDIVPDRELADRINAEYFRPVHKAEADATRMKHDYRERIRALDLASKAKKGDKVSEAYAVQFLGEAEDNIRMIDASRGRMATRDGATRTEWESAIRELWRQSPGLDEAKIRNAVGEFRKIYDELFTRMNEVRVRNGYEPVNYRNGYFPHFASYEGDGILAQFGRALGISTEVTALPTSISGLTHTFKPGIQWFGSALERTGAQTSYDALVGFDKYVEGAASVIFQTDNIQKLRALASEARYRTTSDGLREQVDQVRADENLSDADKQLRIDEIYSSGKYALGNFVQELDEYTNILAGKKSRHDRSAEQQLGRNFYNIMKSMESRVAANMVSVNVSSWLTNFAPLAQGGSEIGTSEVLRAMYETVRAAANDDGFAGRSDFLTNRRGDDPLVQTMSQKVSGILSKPMDWIDGFTSEALVRARYNQNVRRGLSELAAMEEADSWTADVMADRSKGSMPTLFERKSPIYKLATQFQLEVNNTVSYLFKDIPRNQKEKGLAALTAALLKFFVGSYLYNEVYEWIVGRRPAQFDIFGILNDTVGDATGYHLPNLVDLGIGAVRGELPSFETEKQKASDVVTNLGENAIEQLPFVTVANMFGADLDAGRFPVASSIPDVTQLVQAAFNSEWSAKKRWTTAARELWKTATYIGPPFGGGQLKKIGEAIDVLARGGSYTVDNEGNDILQYPVYTDTPGELAGSILTTTMLGKTSTRTGRDWVESGFRKASAAETAAYQAMTEAGAGQQDAFTLIEKLRGAEKTDEASASAEKRRILREAELPEAAEGIAYYTLLASDSEKDLMEALESHGVEPGQVAGLLMDVKDAREVSGEERAESWKAVRSDLRQMTLTDECKGILAAAASSTAGNQYEKLEDMGIRSEDAHELVYQLFLLEPESGKDSVSAMQKYKTAAGMGWGKNQTLAALEALMGSDSSTYARTLQASNAGIAPADYLDFEEFKSGAESDRDADGKTVGGSKRAKVLAYIDSMDLTTKQKDELYYLAGYSSSTLDEAPWY